MSTIFNPGGFYQLGHLQEGYFIATFDRIEKDCDGEVSLAVFKTHMNGEEILIDTDFINKPYEGGNLFWSITDFKYK